MQWRYDMTIAGGVVLEQLNQEQEAWKSQHGEAMECRDFEDLLRRGLTYYNMIRFADEAWSRKVQGGRLPFKKAKLTEIHRLYEWWFKPCDAIMSRLQKMEKGFRIDGAEEFRDACRFVRSILGFKVDEVAESMMQVAKGEMVPLNVGASAKAK